MFIFTEMTSSLKKYRYPDIRAGRWMTCTQLTSHNYSEDLHTQKKNINMLTFLNKQKTQVTHNSSSEVYTVQRDIIILCNT